MLFYIVIHRRTSRNTSHLRHKRFATSRHIHGTNQSCIWILFNKLPPIGENLRHPQCHGPFPPPLPPQQWPPFASQLCLGGKSWRQAFDFWPSRLRRQVQVAEENDEDGTIAVRLSL